jgi:glycosyltransferase involved in cell wall biosynthesis
MISVIIPVFNNPTGMRIALEALSNQSYPKSCFEVIVADNGSTDDTLSVAESFAFRFPCLIRIVSEGAIKSSYAARNAGINNSKGDLIAFTDSDCIPAPNWIERGIKALEVQNNPVVAGRIEMFFTNSNPTIWEYYDFIHNLNQQSYVSDFGFGTTANLFVVKDLFNRYGLFLDNLQSGGDYEFCRRLIKAGEKIGYADDAVVKHPTRSTLSSILKKSKRVARGQKELTRLKLLDHNRLNLRIFFPSTKIPLFSTESARSPHKIILLVVKNILKYYSLAHRVF